MAKAEVIKTNDRIEVVGTEKNPHMKTGKVYEVHPNVAKALIQKGFATENKKK